MHQQTKVTSWDDIWDAEVKAWYFVSKIMGTIITGDFPYFVFDELLTQIQQDPQFEKKTDD